MPVSPKLKAGCGAATLFFSGVICGIVFIFVILILVIPRSEGWKGEESKDFLAEHFSKKVDITDEQRQKLRPGFDAYLNQRWELRARYLKEDWKLLEAYLESVETDLTPEQMQQALEIKEQWRRRKQRMVGDIK